MIIWHTDWSQQVIVPHHATLIGVSSSTLSPSANAASQSGPSLTHKDNLDEGKTGGSLDRKLTSACVVCEQV